MPWLSSTVVLIFGAWTLIAAIITAGVMLDAASRLLERPATARIVITFVEAYNWAGFTLIVFWLVRRFSADRYSTSFRVLLFVIVGVAMACFVTAVTIVLRQTFNAGDIDRPYRPASAYNLVIEALTYTGVLVAGLARHYLLQFQERREQAMVLQAQTLQLGAQLAHARLATLRSQLNPHFLFNTLHAISALTRHDPAAVRRMLSRLSELLRIALDEAETPEQPLRRELDFARKYLDIMQIRFESGLEVKEDIDNEALDALVPTLLLQPLVENAIKHGISRLPRGGQVTLRARRNERLLNLRVENDGPVKTSSAPPGLGLRNTTERLAQLYGAEQRLTLQTDPGNAGKFTVEVTIPFHTAQVRLETAAVAAQMHVGAEDWGFAPDAHR